MTTSIWKNGLVVVGLTSVALGVFANVSSSQAASIAGLYTFHSPAGLYTFHSPAGLYPVGAPAGLYNPGQSQLYNGGRPGTTVCGTGRCQFNGSPAGLYHPTHR